MLKFGLSKRKSMISWGVAIALFATWEYATREVPTVKENVFSNKEREQWNKARKQKVQGKE